MNCKLLWLVLLGCCLEGMLFGADSQPTARLKVLVVTGGHGYEKVPFQTMFNEDPNIRATFDEHRSTNATVFEREDFFEQDVVVLYDIRRTITEAQKTRFESLFEKGIGLVVLHHAIVSYQH